MRSSLPLLTDLPLEELAQRVRSANGGSLPLREWVAVAEAWRIARALREARGNRSAAARELGIGRRTLYTKMEKLGLTPTWVPASDSRLGTVLCDAAVPDDGKRPTGS